MNMIATGLREEGLVSKLARMVMESQPCWARMASFLVSKLERRLEAWNPSIAWLAWLAGSTE
jgi:hypothetical protein